MELNLDTAVVSALIAALAVLVAGRHAARAAARQSKSDKKVEFVFRSAEVAYPRKSELYAEAFAITGKLSKHIIFLKDKPISKRYFEDVRVELLGWENKCGPIFSDETLKAFRALLTALSVPSKSDGNMSRKAKNEVWRKRAWLRGCLRAELSVRGEALLALDED